MKGPALIHGIFYAFIFQDVLHLGIIGEDITVDHIEEIKKYEGGEFEAWLDARYDFLLIQWHKAKAPESSVGSSTPLV